MELEPIESGQPGDPVVSDVNGRLWRVRSRPSDAMDMLVAVLVLALFAAIAVALLA